MATAPPPSRTFYTVAEPLAGWATGFDPSAEDLALARRSLLDTVAVMWAGRRHPLCRVFGRLSEAGRLAALAHVLDYDDLHLPSTTHISAVCVPVALSCGGDARAYLAGAGVMARLGAALGWRHYEAGWHATCTAGAFGAAVTAAVARGLDAERTGVAMALAVPAAGGVQRAFGTSAKSLQVGFAAEAGVRAAALAQAGASADVGALEDWMGLVGGDPAALAAAAAVAVPAVPGGLAIKVYPCCYALQRPIAAVAEFGMEFKPDAVRSIRVTTPASSLAPLIHSRPSTGLEGKFSLEYAIAAALLDGRPGLASFTDEAVGRPEAARLVELVETVPLQGGADLLAGEVEIEVTLSDGECLHARLELPPGAPGRPPTDEELRGKLELCAGGEADRIAALSWEAAAAYVHNRFMA
ncbi:MAG TPA: MmgE/PrpD family protein [Solirubrobacteraceae bacterium]|nr:MmgE/PrpD family protein [Solirubrobacteraceae bacterium]